MQTNLEKLIAHCNSREILTLEIILENAPCDAEYVSLKGYPYARMKKRKDDNFYMIHRAGKWKSSITYKSELESNFVKIEEIKKYLEKSVDSHL